MTSTGGPPEGEQPPPVDLGKSGASEPFDPYRFGKPDTPPPPQYAPPGYVPDPPSAGPQPTAPPPGFPPSGYPGAPGGQGPSGYGGVYPPMPPQQGPTPYGGYPPPYPPYQAQYPGQPAYGPPPYGPYPGAQQGKGKAIAGMVLGIVSIVLCWANFFNLVIIIPGIVFSLLGLNESKTRGTGRGQAIAGLICVAVGIVLTIVVSIIEFHVANSCAGIERGTNAYNRCVRNRI